MSAGFAYAQARIQTRFAALADEPTWQHLEAARSLSGFLEEARQTPLEHWISGFSLASGHHHIEQGLQRELNALIAEARHWAPAPWGEAVVWTTWLQELPRLRHLAAGGAAPAWADTAPPPPPILSPSGEAPTASRWLACWRDLWPAPGRRQRSALEQLVKLIAQHQATFAGLPVNTGWEARQQLGRDLRRLFRRCSLQPAALFAWLALTALELERLRAALVTRAAFPQGDG